MEAKQFGEEYYNDLKRRYANLLKSTPQVVADSLVNNEFVYLTYDSSEIRRIMIKQYLEKTTDMEGVYDIFDPNINIYQLIVCAYHQINKNSYFTLSGQGLTFYQTDQMGNEVSTLMTIDEWEQ